MSANDSIPSNPEINHEMERLQFERDRWQFEREQLESAQKRKESFWRKNSGSLITAFVSITAITISAVQVNLVTQREEPRKEQEQQMKMQDQKIQAAKFVMENSTVITKGTSDEQQLLKDVMDQTFSEKVNTPVFKLLVKNARDVGTVNVFNPNPPQNATTPVPLQSRKVFLQYNDPKDKEMVDSVIGATLSNKGYAVQGSERVAQQTSGDVRYYYDNDEEKNSAAEIKRIVEESLSSKGIKIDLKLLLIKSYKNLPRGVFEVWMPSLRTS